MYYSRRKQQVYESLEQLKKGHTDIGWPVDSSSITDEVLQQLDIYPIIINQIPSYNEEIEKLIVSTPIEIENTDTEGNVSYSYTSTYTVVPLSQEDLDKKAEILVKEEKWVRSLRNKLLAESDWTQLSDSQLNSDSKTAWADYRQQLRDIPGQNSFPKNVVWPTKP